MTDTMTPRARVTDPSTSHQAAASVTELTDKQQRIYEILAGVNDQWGAVVGLTDEQIYERYRAEHGYISPSGCRTRRKELCDVGIVVDSGFRSETEAGRQAIEWCLA